MHNLICKKTQVTYWGKRKKKKSVLFLEDEKKKCTECRKKLLQASDLTSEEFRYLCLKTQEEI